MISPFQRRRRDYLSKAIANGLRYAEQEFNGAAQRVAAAPPAEPAQPPAEPAWTEASKGALLAQLAQAQLRAHEAEQALAADHSATAYAELRRQLAEARTDNAALRATHDRDRERIAALQTAIEDRNAAAGEFGHFEGREHPVWPKPGVA